jgi:hypothetical protein
MVQVRPDRGRVQAVVKVVEAGAAGAGAGLVQVPEVIVFVQVVAQEFRTDRGFPAIQYSARSAARK